MLSLEWGTKQPKVHWAVLIQLMGITLSGMFAYLIISLHVCVLMLAQSVRLQTNECKKLYKIIWNNSRKAVVIGVKRKVKVINTTTEGLIGELKKCKQ